MAQKPAAQQVKDRKAESLKLTLSKGTQPENKGGLLLCRALQPQETRCHPHAAVCIRWAATSRRAHRRTYIRTRQHDFDKTLRQESMAQSM